MIVSNTPKKVVISWVELPAYGAHLICSGIKTWGKPVSVIATEPSIPIRGMEDILGQSVNWIDKESVTSWDDIGLPVPDIFFQAGWYISSFIRLGHEVRDNGGKVVLLADNCWKNSLRQWMGAIKYRLVYRKQFSAVWVPGESGAQLFRHFGVRPSRIFKGLYGSDSDCFSCNTSLIHREKQFVYLGRFVHGKGIPHMIRAFSQFHAEFPDWKLLAFGKGECQSMLEGCPGIEVNSFAQPPQIAEVLKCSRFLVLPSLADHWPLVVSEAALAGCGLILSDKVGNRKDLLNSINGFVYPANSIRALEERMKAAASLSNNRLEEIAAESNRLGSMYGPERWAETFQQIISTIGDG